MEIVVYPVAPSIAPPVGFKERFPNCRWIKRPGESYRAPVDHHGPQGVVRNEAVVTKPKGRNPRGLQQPPQLFVRRTTPAARTLNRRFYTLHEAHNVAARLTFCRWFF